MIHTAPHLPFHTPHTTSSPHSTPSQGPPCRTPTTYPWRHSTGEGEGGSRSWQWWQWWSAAADGKDKSRQWHSAWGLRGSVLPTACAASVGGVHAPKPRTAQIHLTRSTVGVVCVALERCVHRIGGSHHVKLSLLEAVQHTTSHIVQHARVWYPCLCIHLLIVSRRMRLVKIYTVMLQFNLWYIR